VAVLSNFKADPLKTLHKNLEFKFDESRSITVDAEVTTADPSGWDILKGATTEVCYSYNHKI